MKEDIPRKTVYRLSLYHRCLERLTETGPISSEALAEFAGVKPTQLRKDLAHCGHFGKRGLGYDIEKLRDHLGTLLHQETLQPVILVGAGNLGSALLRYQEFNREGFKIVAAFDSEPAARRRDSETPVWGMSRLGQFIREQAIKIAILCIPAAAAQDVCDLLVGNGIQAILNFAPLILKVPEKIAVNNVNLAVELENLSYFAK